MTEADPLTVEPVATPPLLPEPLQPARLLRVSRGFACLFWSLPLLAFSYAYVLISPLPMRWMFGLLLVSFMPMICGLWTLRACGLLTSRWGTRLGRLTMLILVSIYLCPFWVWWKLSPMHLYFAANVAVHSLVMLLLLVELNRLAGECARWMGDKALRRESQAGWMMVVWLSLCTVMALVWLFYRAGLLEAGLLTVLAQLSELPREARYLFLLPYAMTAYVMWRAKTTSFRRAVESVL